TSNVQMSVIPTISEETGNFPFLQKFLKEAPLEEITISRILHETWRLYGFQTNNDDCARIVNILAEIRYLWNELKSLVDANLFRSKFYESETWKLQAERNIGSLKDAMRKGNTAVHGQILREIDKLDLNNLTYDDPICNGVVDLKCDRFLINEVDFDILVGDKANIRNIVKEAPIKNLCAEFVRKKDEIQTKIKFIITPSQVVYHDHWVEPISVREGVAQGIIDFILQEIRTDIICRISGHSEGTYMEMIGRLIDVTMCDLPLEFKIDITRSEQQSVASKNRKIHQGTGSRGNKPDIMIRAFFQWKWNEITYAEGGKWDSDEKKRLDDHNSLVRFCSDGYDELSRKFKKEKLRSFLLVFRINVAGNTLIINGLTSEKGARFNFPISETMIPLFNESVQEVEDFVHALLTLRNGVIVNLQNLRNSSKKKCKAVDPNDSPLHEVTIRSPR
ncbi:1161_t:CDS:2, partial [Entrophospora sp. SA101]